MKNTLIIFLLLIAVGFGGIFLVFRSVKPITPDMAAINDAVMTSMQNENQSDAVAILTNELIREYDNFNQSSNDRNRTLMIIMGAYTIILGVVVAGFYLYYERRILSPFRKLQRFAKDVAMGNLDIPLEMDKHGSFGAFSESFDLMREELKNARDSERAANRSKKELVASLSHDIKTPVASIKAATELMLVSANTDKEKQQLDKIREKAEQINGLITDMFHATLEELQALTVTASASTMQFGIEKVSVLFL
jgi:signal transduction histidine kinase